MGLVNRDFRARHLKALSIIGEVHSRGSASRADRAELKRLLGSYAKILIEHFTLVPENEPARMNKSNPKILLTSFKGCKGLSAGHVFMVGVHAGSIPKDQTNITDVEISQFIVALTRTRKRCHILSDLWFRSPKDKMGRWLQPHTESLFISWLPQHLMDNRGILKSQDL